MVAKHCIVLNSTDAPPTHSAPQQAGSKQRKLEREEVDKMREAGLADPAKTKWALPIVFVPRNDGSLRFFVDYRRLNSVTERDSYSIPRMDESIDSLAKGQIFSTLDANSGYCQPEVDEKDIDKNVFVTNHGISRYARIPFGLKNDLARFQRAINITVASVKRQHALVYIDDNTIFSKTREALLKHVDELLRLLLKAGVTIKLKKSHFYCKGVDYLGHVVAPGKLLVARKISKTVEALQEPTNIFDVRLFLGFCTVYRRVVPNFARLAALLNKKLKRGDSFQFNLDAVECEAVDILEG